MSVFQCKMCGGQLDVLDGENVATCPYCNTKQTIPKLSDDKVRKILEKANSLRINGEYDKAIEQYERLIEDDTVTDAEVYWNMVLSKYGVLYVDDPSTGEKVPTINRTQMTSVFLDDAYKKTIDLADPTTRQMYEEEAKKIDKIQQEILSISNNEKPYDIFICYKETDDNGEKTQDSIDAYQIYHNLTDAGYRVFFSRVSLEGKVGKYEPYIFAALNTAKVMLVIGGKKEYFEAPWVKNEWNRFLHLMKKEPTKRNLIPCYKNITPYDLPKELSYLQAQNMNSIGFMQDLIRGINKVFNKNTTSSGQQSANFNAKKFDVVEILNKIKSIKPKDVINFANANKKLSLIAGAVLLAFFGISYILGAKTYNIKNANKARVVSGYSRDTNVNKLDMVKFGKYPKNDINGGKREDLDWIVLTKDNESVTLLCKYVIDNKLYNDLRGNTTWEECSLRTWLNNDFYNVAFSDSDKSYILQTDVINESNPSHDTQGGNNTKDKVYLLSVSEVINFFGKGDSSDSGRNLKAATIATKYAQNCEVGGKVLRKVTGHGKYAGNTEWLLRTPGVSQSSICSVDGGGSVNDWGFSIQKSNGDAFGIRPVIRVKIK